MITRWGSGTLPSNSISALVQTRDRHLWLGTAAGLARFDGSEFVVFNSAQTPSFGDGMPGHDTARWLNGQRETFAEMRGRQAPLAMAEDARGGIWIGTRRRGLVEYRQGTLKHHDVTRDVIQALCFDSSGALWIGTAHGLLRFHQGRTQRYDRRDGLSHDNVTALLEDRHGNLWVGTGGGGLNRRTEGRFSRLTTLEGLSDDDVRGLLEDHEGNLWVGTADGLKCLSEGRFTTYGRFEGLREPAVASVAASANGGVWLGLASGGVARLRGGVVEHFALPAGLGWETARALHETRDGSLWIAQDNGRLFRLKDGVVSEQTPRGAHEDWIVRAIWEDEQGPVFLVGILGPARLQGRRLVPLEPSPKLGVLRYPHAAYGDGRGTLWVCDLHGLARLQRGVEALHHRRRPAAHPGAFGQPRARRQLMGGHRRRARLSQGRRRPAGDHAAGPARELPAPGARRRAGPPVGGLHGVPLPPRQARAGRSLRGPDRPRAPHPLRYLRRPAHHGGPAGQQPRLPRPGRPALVRHRQGRGRDRSRARLPEPRARPAGDDGAAEGRWAGGRGPGVPARPRRGPARVHRAQLPRPGQDPLPPSPERLRRGLGGRRERPPRLLQQPASGALSVLGDGLQPRRRLERRGGHRRLRHPPALPSHRAVLHRGGRPAAGLAAAGHRLRLRQVRSRFTAVVHERTRIARELHDTLAQGLAGVKLHIDSALSSLVSRPEVARRSILCAQSIARSSLGEVRRSIWVLRAQAAKGEDDLGSTLAESVGQLAADSGLEPQVTVEGQPGRLPVEVERNLLRVAHEAVTNAVRHSGGRTLAVELRFAEGAAHLRVQDDGRGFDPESYLHAPRGEHFGLLGMRERVQAVGGALEIRSGEGHGTEIVCRLPYNGHVGGVHDWISDSGADRR